jgi:hypothetical protein
MLASIYTYPWAGEIKEWDDAWIGSASRRSEVHPRVLSPRRDWQGAERRDEYTGEGRGGGHIPDQPDSEEKTETRTGTGKAGIESTRELQIVACSAAETTTEVEAGNVALRETEGTLKRKSPARNTTFICKSPASNTSR